MSPRFILPMPPDGTRVRGIDPVPSAVFRASVSIAACVFCLFASATHADATERNVTYGYEQPSDEMDFDVPPAPGLDQAAPPPPLLGAPAPGSDRFFSDAPVLEEPVEPKTEVASPAEEVKKPPKKLVRYAPPKPPYNFKSVLLPDTIYKKRYDRKNRHLPVAYYTEDVERGVVASAARGEISALRALKKLGAPLDVHAENGDPILTVVARTGNANTMHWLLIQGVGYDRISSEGLTALHYAAYRGNPEMVELLLAYGADANRTDARGVPPLTYAERSGSEKTVRTLLEFGANPPPL